MATEHVMNFGVHAQPGGFAAGQDESELGAGLWFCQPHP